MHVLVLLDMHRSALGGVPEDNIVGLQAALVRTTPGDEEAQKILTRLGAALAGPEHEGLRRAFAQWLRRSWDEDYDVDADAALCAELDRLESAGEMEAMGSLAAERWKERQRQKEAQIWARGFVLGFVQAYEQVCEQANEQANERAIERANKLAIELGRAEALEYHRRTMCRHVTRRFNASTGERLSALLAGVSEPDRLKAVSDAVVDAVVECGTGEELIATARRIVDAGD